MDVVIISGGLGNQMSQYAFYLAKKRHDRKVRVIFNPASANIHNGSELAEDFGIEYGNGVIDKALSFLYKYYDGIPKLRKYFSRLLRVKSVYEDRSYDYNPALLVGRHRFGITFFMGGWHSEKYFKDFEDDVRRLYTFKLPNDDVEFSRMEKSIKDNPASVSVHVRRGDYINHPDFWGIADEDYYRKAIEKIRSKMVNPTFYVFSNDLEWSHRFFQSQNVNYTIVNVGGGKKSYLDMYLMSLCRAHINANSTFSWWGAWLSAEDSITICPDKFMNNVTTKDIYPERWIRIQR